MPALSIEVQTLQAIAIAAAGIGIAAMVVILQRLVSDGKAPGPTLLRRQGGGSDAGLIRAALDALPQPVQLLDAGGRVVLANTEGRRLAEIKGEAGTVAWQTIDLGADRAGHVLRVGREETGAEIAALEEARSRAEAANEAKSRFLATVSHEFRTPLNGILGMTRLLMETGLDAEQTTYAQAVKSSAEAFLSLVDDMLDMAMIEAGRIPLADEPFDLVALTQGVAELLAPRAQGKGTEIGSYVGPGVPRIVRGDADRLRQVLINLAGNAVKFTRSGGAGIRVERAEGGGIAFCVEDTGPGIAPDQAATIFEEFEQAGPASDGESGTGLGLAITRRLVDRMGGRITLDTTPGAGSRFRFVLDLPAAETEMQDAKAQVTTRRVLILSRSVFEAGYLARMIGDAGGRARVVKTLGEAVDAMGCESFDVLLADHGLPDGDVRVAVSEARRRGLSRTIVMLSPFERHDLGSPHAAGFDAYLIKPVRTRSLLEQIADQRRPVPTPAFAQAEAQRDQAGRPGGQRVLLVEDNEINALLAMKTLQRLGAIVEWSRNGRGALARLSATLRGEDAPIDLVLMDLRMPDLDGREVTRRIRQEEALAGTVTPMRIVALTASVVGNPDDIVREAGFDGLLTKPFGVEALAAELDGMRLREAV